MKNIILEALKAYEGSDFLVNDELVKFIEEIKVSKPIVIIEVNGGVAEYTVGNTGVGVDVIIIDHDNPSVEHCGKPNNVMTDNECDKIVIDYEQTYYEPNGKDPDGTTDLGI